MMMMTKIFKISAIIFCFCVHFQQINASDDDNNNDNGQFETIPVQLKIGKIIGKRLHSKYGMKYDQFLGIPYAQSPINELRFRRPQPLEQLTKQPYEAFEWPSICLQSNPWEISSLYNNFNMSEDCLYLNIWSPNVNVHNENELKPVFVYIHGGGLIFSGSTIKNLEGHTLSVFADAVVVTLNYRLSILGLLYSDEVDHIKGNMALWDQALALEWIQQNIRYFGGDPNQVTIAGCSAGSWSISSHILSPVSRNLFKNAIMMSGSIQNQAISKEKSVEFWLDRLRLINCATDSDRSIDQKMIECLNQMDAMDMMKNILIESKLDAGYIVVDGEFVPEHPFKMLRDGNHKKDFSLLLSTTKDEGSAFMQLLLAFYNRVDDGKKFDFNNPEPLNCLDEAKDILSFLTKPYLSQSAKISSEQMSKIYFNGLNPLTDDSDQLRRTIGQAFGDMWLACPTMDFGHWISKNNVNNHVYQIYHTYYPVKTIAWCPKWTDGTCHGDDEWTLFGHPLLHPKYYNNRLRNLSYELMMLVRSFVRYGRPDQVEQPEWQNYFHISNDHDDDDDVIVVKPYYELSNNYRTVKSYSTNLKHVECEFWRPFYRYYYHHQ